MEDRKGALEKLGMISHSFWENKKVFVTGDTGFKGSWLCLWLYKLGANVKGFSLGTPTTPSIYELCNLDKLVDSVYGDIRNPDALKDALIQYQPDIVIHMAAQPLLRESYRDPVGTYATNIMGTVHLYEALRYCNSVRAVVNVTTDKCYENKEWVWGYRENDPLGGFDPYSSSKACAELITAAYRNSYFHPANYEEHGVAIATARAGNVIGGGDWASDRLVPDCFRAFTENRPVIIRNPSSTRPWQHVLEPLSGYLRLAQKLFEFGPSYAEGWNFGPDDEGNKDVKWIVSTLCEKWGHGARFVMQPDHEQFHEAHFLKLDCSKSRARLGWVPQWTLEVAIERICDWMKTCRQNGDLLTVTLQQIEQYEICMDKGGAR